MLSLHLAPMGQISHHNIGLCVCLRANTQYNNVKAHLAKKMFYLFEGSLIIVPCRKHSIFLIWNFDLFYLKLFLHKPFSMGILHYQSCSSQHGNSCDYLRITDGVGGLPWCELPSERQRELCPWGFAVSKFPLFFICHQIDLYSL